jgi:predicted TIM-barrel fold metal-dependent hydrolase
MGLSSTGVQQCIELFGVDRVLLGTDYPAVPISPKEHIDIVRGLGLSPVDQAKILWKNADDLFKLGLTEQVRVAAAREG